MREIAPFGLKNGLPRSAFEIVGDINSRHNSKESGPKWGATQTVGAGPELSHRADI